MKKLRIDITGCSGAGKSTIGTLIAHTLREHGFKNVSTDVLNEIRRDRRPDWLLGNQARLDSLKDNTDVVIRECWPDKSNWESDLAEWASRVGVSENAETAEMSRRSLKRRKK